jgi:hypothetical protein
MEPVYSKTKTNETIVFDEHYFVRCTFTNCTLVYCGGEFGWDQCQFQNCRISIQGAAGRVLAFLNIFGLMKSPDQVPPNVVPPQTSPQRNN